MTYTGGTHRIRDEASEHAAWLAWKAENLAPDRREAARDEEILARPARPVVLTGPCVDPWCPLATINTESPHVHPHPTDPPDPF